MPGHGEHRRVRRGRRLLRGRRGPPAAGRPGRRRGGLPGAHEVGRDPQPGLALLRLAQGRVDAAAASIAAALADSDGSRLERAPLLAAQVEIALAAGDVGLADAAAAEVVDTAETFDSAGLRAAGLPLPGRVRLAQGQPVEALGALRLALTVWQELDAPYEVARTRVLLAEAYRALGDADAADREEARRAGQRSNAARRRRGRATGTRPAG